MPVAGSPDCTSLSKASSALRDRLLEVSRYQIAECVSATTAAIRCPLLESCPTSLFALHQYLLRKYGFQNLSRDPSGCGEVALAKICAQEIPRSPKPPAAFQEA